MSTGYWRIKPSEIERTLRSIRSVGLHIRSVELAADGTVKITVNESETAESLIETSEQLRKLL
jgi:acetolactate synthase regulatory subunit